ncbi:MAG: NifU family protein [Proteobacteria bacterium]|nr:NifU family protein [Pseudomonadota bacterium]MDA1057717.1 NifU family protein [Pseudomonadota bacterium]
MFIQTEQLEDPSQLRFNPGREVLAGGGEVTYVSHDEAKTASPLAARLFEAGDISRVTLLQTTIVIEKQPQSDWAALKPAMLVAIMDHLTLGHPIMNDDGVSIAPTAGADDPVSARIREIIEERVMPVVSRDGGEVIFVGYEDGDVILELKGSARSLIGGIENMIRHFVPEVERVVDHLDAIPKPGLDTPEGLAVRRVLDEQINPSVASHGGHIALVDVQGDTVYIRLEGGCQGCGMADVTLKQGVEVAIKQAVPSINAVLDSTDHAGGQNPYFQAGKGGMEAY